MLDDVEEECLEKDDRETCGVLLSDEIEHYATKYDMIVPFNNEGLRAASYTLHLGEEYVKGGKRGSLYRDIPDKNILVIPPFEVVIISTKEEINLPRFIIARWNLKVKRVYEGLLWTGGPQVDPGWCGRLYCPIYNLSSKDVELSLGDDILVMDFIKTTPFEERSCKKFSRPPKRKNIGDYNHFESALVANAQKRVDELEKKFAFVYTLIGLLFTVLAVLFTTLSIFVTQGTQREGSLLTWMFVSFTFSIFAIVVAGYTHLTIKIRKK